MSLFTPFTTLHRSVHLRNNSNCGILDALVKRVKSFSKSFLRKIEIKNKRSNREFTKPLSHFSLLYFYLTKTNIYQLNSSMKGVKSHATR